MNETACRGTAIGACVTERVEEPLPLIGHGYNVGKAADRLAGVVVELDRLLETLRGSRPTPCTVEGKRPAQGTAISLFERNITDLNDYINQASDRVAEVQRLVGNL